MSFHSRVVTRGEGVPVGTPFLTKTFKEILKDWILRAIEGESLYFLTLTPNKNCSVDYLEPSIEHWIRRLKNSYFGRRKHPDVFHLVMFERGFNGHLHAHVLIQDLSLVETKKVFKNTEEFPKVAMRLWLELDISGKPIAQDIRRVYAHEGILDYVLKDLWCSKNIDNLSLNLLSLPPKYTQPPHVPSRDNS